MNCYWSNNIEITNNFFTIFNNIYFIEINARYGGGAPLGFAAGVKSPHWYLSIASGLELKFPPIGSYKKNLYLSRYDNSLFMDEKNIKSNSI